MNSARHVPPADDDDQLLDAVELALVRALAAIIVRNIREEVSQRNFGHQSVADSGNSKEAIYPESRRQWRELLALLS